MTWIDFMINFWPNFFATLLAGTLLGFLIEWYLSRKNRDEEKKGIELEKNISKAKVTLDFLNTIKLEIEDIVFDLDSITKNIDTKNDLQYLTLQYFHFDISFWEILKTSGEIPSLFEPIVLQVFTNFYAKVAKCNLIHEQYVFAKINNQSKAYEKELHDEILKSLKSLKGMVDGSKIELMISQEIAKTNDLLIQLESHQKNFKKK